MFKNRYKNLPLKGKLVGLVVVSIFVALIAGYGVLLISSVNQLRQEMLISSRHMTHMIADFVVAPLSFNDMQGAQQVISHLDLVPEVRGVILFNSDGEKVVDYHTSSERLPDIQVDSVSEKFSDSLLYSVSPVKLGDQLFGKIVVVSTTELLDERIFTLILIISAVFVLMLFVGLFFALRLQKYISQPLIKLTQVTREIGLEAAPEVLHISHEADDEIKELYDAFDNMLRRLKNESSERNKVQEALAASESRFRGIVQDQTEVICRFNGLGMISFVNHAFAELVGLDEGEFIEQTIFDWIHPDDQRLFRKQVDELTVDRPVVTSIVRFRPEDSSLQERVLEWTTRAVFRDSNVIEEFQGVGRDMTELRQAQEEKQRVERQLQHSQRLETIGTLAGGIAHDFNNLLTPVRGYIDLLAREIDPADPRFQRVMRIGEAVSRARELIDQILTFGRKVEPQKDAVSLGDLVSSVLAFIRSTISKDIEIQTEIMSERVFVQADESQIHQTIMNLCMNACYAMNVKGGGRLSVSVKMVQLGENDIPPGFKMSAGEHIELLVSDTGIGMEPQVRERVFEPFFTTKKVGEGSGLGLSVVHGIITDHNGSITVESEVGKGTTFRVLLPRGVEDVKQEDSSQQFSDVVPAMGQILVVDDEPMIVEMCRDMLEMIGYKVCCATSPSGALEELRECPERFDLVLTDQTMPGMTGLELAEKIQDLSVDIPVIISTGYSAETIGTKKMEECGVVGCLKKPYELDELANMVAAEIMKSRETAVKSSVPDERDNMASSSSSEERAREKKFS